MAPMPLTGTIGTSSSIKGDGEAVPHRRTLPEPVVTFNLPVIRRPAVAQLERAARKTKQAVKEDVNMTEAAIGEAQLSLEASHILLQSFRQSRLIHLNAMLPYLSTRHRMNTKYHSAPLDHPFPGGLEPPTTPHSLIHLGRADIRIGPLIFPKTRFGEVRVERRLSEGAVVPPSATKAELKKEQRELKEQRKAEKKQAKSQVGSRNASPGNTSKVADASAADAAKTSSAKPSATTSPQPPIDDAVVQAVSKAGQKDPKLQALLHKAANGKAAPEELRDLAKFISHVSERLEKEKKTTATQNRSVPSRAAPTSAAATASSEQGDPQAAPSRASLPHHQVSQPSHSPIVTIEYKENPNARFILPLWRGCAVERISQSDLRSIKVTMLLPAIGSAAATRASHIENKPSKKATLSEAKELTSTHKTSDIPTDAQLTAAAPKGAETHSVTYHISGNTETPLPDGIWQCFGRIKGVKTIIDGKVLDSSDDETLQQFIVKLRNLERESFYLPKLQVSPDEEMKELSEHLYDKFVPRMHTVLARPIVKLKKGDGGDEDEVEIVRDTSKKRKLHDKKSAGEEKRTKRASLASNHDGQGDILEEGSVSADEVGNPSKPKRKRHVAKYNSDGTLKLCQACGTNSTPMWRRGPAGKSTLCNACGAKWKVGRLIVSNEGAITPAEERNADVSMSLDVDKQGRAADGDVPSEKPLPMETGVATEQEGNVDLHSII